MHASDIGFRLSSAFIHSACVRIFEMLTKARTIRMKALLFTLIRAFEFDLAVPAEEVEKMAGIVQRPTIRSAKEKGSHMPLIITKYRS